MHRDIISFKVQFLSIEIEHGYSFEFKPKAKARLEDKIIFGLDKVS